MWDITWKMGVHGSVRSLLMSMLPKLLSRLAVGTRMSEMNVLLGRKKPP